MGTPTTNLGIIKPAGTDAFNRSAFNVILDQIDAAAVPNSKLGTGANQVPIRDVNGNIQNNGNKITAKTANATLLLTESGIIDVTTGASVITLTLPSAATAQLSYIIKKIDAGAGSVTINTTSSQTIDGALTKSITYQYGYIQVVSDGANWQIIDGSSNATSANSDISITNGLSNPVFTLNSGLGANQSAKRDANGNLLNIGYQAIPVSANTTLTPAQSGIIDVTTGSSTITITLPSAATAQLSYIIKKADSGSGSISIATTSAQLIDGASTKTVSGQYGYLQVVSDGTGWQIVDGSNAATVTAGAADDTAIGNRTVNDVTTPAAGPSTLTTILSQFGNLIKNITGGANWYTAPTTSLAALLTALGLKAPLASPVFTGTVTIPALGAEMDAGSHTIGFTEFDNGSSGSAATINFKVSNKQKISVNANTTLSFTAPTKPCSLTLKLTYTGSFTVTLPTHKKQNGVALTFSSVNAAVDILSIYWDGTSYFIMNSLNWS